MNFDSVIDMRVTGQYHSAEMIPNGNVTRTVKQAQRLEHMKKLASVVSAPYPWFFQGFPRSSGFLYIALLLLPGGLILLALLWWLGHRNRKMNVVPIKREVPNHEGACR
jgi:hypothetical protein